MVSSAEDIKELSEAPVDQLSLHAVAKEMLQPKYTMQGFEWKDQRGVEGTGFVRALRCLMTSRLPNLLPSLRCTLENEMMAELKNCQTSKGETHLKVFPSIKRIVAKTNSLFFFGDELCRLFGQILCNDADLVAQNPDFTNAALQYPQDVFVAGEAVRSVPQVMASFAASLTTRGHRASKVMFDHLAPVIDRRLEIRGKEGPSKPVKSPPSIEEDVLNTSQIDCMQYLIDTSPRKTPWTVQRTIGEIMAVWFSSVHQLAMAATFALEDLCVHPECVEPLRQELEENMNGAAVLDLDAFPLLDSFLKESSRLSVSDAISVRRKALKDLDCFNGTHVNEGDWVCVAQRAMMHDSDHYSDPEAFDAFRFARKRPDGQSQELRRFTDVKPDWLIWGYGNTTWCVPSSFLLPYATNEQADKGL
ncbi:MAG: hypothetical protein Q9180_002997, partial [Flavoplaca navasiana]